VRSLALLLVLEGALGVVVVVVVVDVDVGIVVVFSRFFVSNFCDTLRLVDDEDEDNFFDEPELLDTGFEGDEGIFFDELEWVDRPCEEDDKLESCEEDNKFAGEIFVVDECVSIFTSVFMGLEVVELGGFCCCWKYVVRISINS